MITLTKIRRETLRRALLLEVKSCNATDILFKISINGVVTDVRRNIISYDKFNDYVSYLIHFGKYLWLTIFGEKGDNLDESMIVKSASYIHISLEHYRNMAYIYLLKFMCGIKDTDIVQSFYNDSNTNVSEILRQYSTDLDLDFGFGMFNIVTTDPNHLFCIDCYNNTMCQFCISCSDSEDLVNCDNCVDCHCMQNCSDCIECNNCSNSQNLRFCSQMIDCKCCNYCNECYDSSYAFDCNSCYKLHGGISCINCAISRNLIQCNTYDQSSNHVKGDNHIELFGSDNTENIRGDWPGMYNETMGWIENLYHVDFYDDDWKEITTHNFIAGPNKIDYIKERDKYISDIDSVYTCYVLVKFDKLKMNPTDITKKTVKRKIVNSYIHTFKIDVCVSHDFEFKLNPSNKQIIDLDDNGNRIEFDKFRMFMYDTDNNLLFKGLYAIDEQCNSSYTDITASDALKYMYVIQGTFYYTDIQSKCCNMYMTTNSTWIKQYIELRKFSKDNGYREIKYSTNEMLEIFRTRRIYLKNIITANDKDTLLDLVTNHVLSGEYNFIDIYDRNANYARSYATFGK